MFKRLSLISGVGKPWGRCRRQIQIAATQEGGCSAVLLSPKFAHKLLPSVPDVSHFHVFLSTGLI